MMSEQKKYKVSLSTVERIWYQYKDSTSKNKDGVGDVGNKRRESCGRKRKATVLDSLEEMKKLPEKHKKSQTRLTIGTGVFKSQLDTVYLDEKLFYVTIESKSYSFGGQSKEGKEQEVYY